MTDPLAIHAILTERVLEPMKRLFVDKDEIIDLLGVCLVARENIFLLGPPGTAKSALIHELARRIDGHTFDYLLTRFTEPNELFGPFDIRRLRDGELVTNTEGMLPEASLVFLDELLNANSAILNSLLMALNERVFRRGKETRELPALMIVGASNRLPEEEGLVALFDRFLVRAHSDNVPDAKLATVLEAGWRLDAPAATPPAIVPEQIRQLSALLGEVRLDPVKETYLGLVRSFRKAGVAVSDRRAVKLQRLVAASSLLCGRLEAQPSDCWVMRHTWDTQEQREIMAGIVARALAGTVSQPGAHPQSASNGLPDPEHLARDFAAIASDLDRQDDGSAGRAALRDRLGILSGRCQWVQDAAKRAALQVTLDELLRRATPAVAAR